MKDMDMGLIRMSVDHVNGVAIGNFSNASRNEAIRDKFREILGMEDGRFDDMAWERGKLECFAYLREVYKQVEENGLDKTLNKKKIVCAVKNRSEKGRTTLWNTPQKY